MSHSIYITYIFPFDDKSGSSRIGNQSLTQALKQLYESASVQERKEAEKWLLDRQSQPQVWPESLQLLYSQVSRINKSPNAQFYAAQSLYMNVQRDWSILGSDVVEQIGASLRDWISSQGKTTTAFVTIKVCLTLSVYTLKSCESLSEGIQAFLIHIQKSLETSEQHYHTYFARIIVQYLTFIPEEAQKVFVAGTNARTLPMRVSEVSQAVLELIIPYLQHQNTEIQELSLTCLSSWVANCTIPIDILIPLLKLVIKKMNQFELLEVISEVLSTLFADKRLVGMEKTVPELFLPVVLGETYQSKLSESLEDEVEEFLLPFSKIMSKFGEVFSKYLIENLPATMPFFDSMLLVTGFTINVDVPQSTFFFWFNLEDSLDTTNEITKKTYSPEIANFGHQIMNRLLETLVLQMQYPTDGVLQTWSTDQKEKLKNHRVECADTALYCYYNLQEKSLELVFSVFQRELDHLSNNPQHGTQLLEAAVYCLKSFSEAVPGDEDTWVPCLFQPGSLNIIQQLISANRDGSRQLRLTLAGCFGNYSEWLATHPDYLPASLNFLLHELANCDHPTAAAISLTELAALCQIPLSKHADDVLNLCMSSLPAVPVHVQSRIIQAMVYIIQALPVQEALPRSRFILDGIVQQLQQDIDTREGTGDSVVVREAVILHLDFYKSFCKGSNKTIVELETTEPPPLSKENHDLGSKLHAVIEKIFGYWGTDVEIGPKACDVLKDSCRCDSPIITALFPNFLQLLTSAFVASQQACFLSVISAVLDHSTPQFISQFQGIYEQCSSQVVFTFAEKCSSMAQMQQDPDIPFDFFEFFIALLRKMPQIVNSFNEQLCRVLFLDCLVQGMDLQEQLAIQAILKFLREFVGMGYEGSPLEHFSKEILSITGVPIIRHIIKGISGGHPSSLVPKLGQTLLQFFIFFPIATQQGLVTCLSEPGFPSMKISSEDKEQFIKALAGTRKPKLFNDTIRAFSTKCRGL